MTTIRYTPEIYDIFISYHYDSKPQVLKLYDKLTETYELKVWLDLKSLKVGDDLSEKILYGIRASKLLICCMTKNYSNSTHSQKELVVADNFRKRIVVLMFENHRMQDLGKIGLIMDRFIRINIFKDANAIETWRGNLASALFFTIETMLGIDLSAKLDKENELHKKEMKAIEDANRAEDDGSGGDAGVEEKAQLEETKSNKSKSKPIIENSNKNKKIANENKEPPSGI